MAGTLIVDEALQRRLVADSLRYNLLRPPMIAACSLTGLALALSVLVFVLSPQYFTRLWWAIALLLLTLAFVIGLTVFVTRRSVRLGMPVGSEFSASVGEGLLRTDFALGRSDIRINMITRAQVAGEALLVRWKGSPVMAMIPRRLLSDEELAALGVRNPYVASSS